MPGRSTPMPQPQCSHMCSLNCRYICRHPTYVYTIYAHVLSAHVYMCVHECTHLTHMPVSCMLIPILSHVHMYIFLHAAHTSQTHPIFQQRKAFNPFAKCRSVICSFQTRVSRFREVYIALYGAMHEASRERPQVKACKAANIQLMHMPL